MIPELKLPRDKYYVAVLNLKCLGYLHLGLIFVLALLGWIGWHTGGPV